jgi:hypothetical protein
MLDVDAEHHGLFHGAEAAQEIGQMLYHPSGTVGEGDVALKLRCQTYITQLSFFGHIDFGALLIALPFTK